MTTPQPSIGEQLRNARQAHGLSLSQVAAVTRIRQQYLQALEDNRYDDLPSQVQARGFLRAYANYLNMDAESLVNLLQTGDLTPPIVSAASENLSNGGRQIPLPTESLQAFEEIGKTLRQRREMLGISLAEAARQTYIRLNYLEFLENGDFESLPSPVQGRGMLNNYATFLGLNPDPLLLRFADGLQARRAAKIAPRRPSQKTTRRFILPAWLRRWFGSELWVSIILVTGLVAFILWGMIEINASLNAVTPQPTVPSIADVLLPSQTPTPTASATFTPADPDEILIAATPTSEISATPTPIFDPASRNTVQVYVTVRQRAWLRVISDGKVEFEGRVFPGSAYAFSGDERVEILTGNGAALQIFYNQQNIGALGAFGEVVHRVFVADGMQTPTPTITPTSTITLTPTRTPPVTPTASGD